MLLEQRWYSPLCKIRLPAVRLDSLTEIYDFSCTICGHTENNIVKTPFGIFSVRLLLSNEVDIMMANQEL